MNNQKFYCLTILVFFLFIASEKVFGNNIIFSSQSKCTSNVCSAVSADTFISPFACVLLWTNQDLHQGGWIIKNIFTRINQIDLKNDKACHLVSLIGMRHARKVKTKRDILLCTETNKKILANVSFALTKTHAQKKNNIFLFPIYFAQKKWKFGRVVAKKQPQAVKIPPSWLTINYSWCQQT